MESTTTACKRWLGMPDPVLAREIWRIRWLLPWVIDGKPLTSSVSPSKKVSPASYRDRWVREVAGTVLWCISVFWRDIESCASTWGLKLAKYSLQLTGIVNVYYTFSFFFFFKMSPENTTTTSVTVKLSGDGAIFSRTSQFTLLSFSLPDLSIENVLSSYGNAHSTHR